MSDQQKGGTEVIDVEPVTHDGLTALNHLSAMLKRGSINDATPRLCDEIERSLLAQDKALAAERARADALAEELRALREQSKAALDLPDCDFPKWKELLIADMQTSYDTDGITHEDSGDPLIYLQSAIAIIEDFAAPAPASPSEQDEQDEQPQCYYVGMIDGQHVVRMVDGSLVPAHGTAYYTRHAPASQERALPEGWVTLGVGDGSGSLFVHGPYEAVKECQRKLMAASQDDAADRVANICNAYESGVGHRGRPTALVNPYPRGSDESIAYALGAIKEHHGMTASQDDARDAALRDTLAMLENCTITTGQCMCGDDVNYHGHGISDHAPVDAGSHHAGQLHERIAAILAAKGEGK